MRLALSENPRDPGVDGGGDGPGGRGRVRKVFIVARERPDVYASLCRALESESDVFVIYDRRLEARDRGRWRSLWSAPELSGRGDRRRRTDVDDEIRERGFGVVHLTRSGSDDDVSEDAYDDDEYVDERDED